MSCLDKGSSLFWPSVIFQVHYELLFLQGSTNAYKEIISHNNLYIILILAIMKHLMSKARAYPSKAPFACFNAPFLNLKMGPVSLTVCPW
jgi:hypothetical protein